MVTPMREIHTVLSCEHDECQASLTVQTESARIARTRAGGFGWRLARDNGHYTGRWIDLCPAHAARATAFVPEQRTPDVVPDMAALPEAPVSPAPFVCTDCKQEAPVHARDRCKPCYMTAYRLGTVGDAAPANRYQSKWHLRVDAHPHPADVPDGSAGVWALVEQAQAGDAEAFGQIYDKYADTVFRFIYFRVGNRPLAEDLTGDTFLRALKRIASFTWQGKDLGAWLITIARNLVADHFKSGRYRLEVTTGDVLDADREDRDAGPEEAVVDHITNVALLTAVKKLNPHQQEVIVLRFLRGLSVAETADAMYSTEGAVKALQYRATRALAQLLPEGFQP